MPNVRSTETPTPGTTIWNFEIEPGEWEIALPSSIETRRIRRVCIVGARNRPLPLAVVPVDFLGELGRKFEFGEQSPTLLRGMPVYFAIKSKTLHLWPAPAHRWSGFIEYKEGENVSDQTA
jgi:hypothetical protein